MDRQATTRTEPAPRADAFAPSPGQSVRICVCGAVNPVTAQLCLSCGEDISDVMPAVYAGEAPAAAAAEHVPEPGAAFGGALIRLVSVDGLCTLDVSASCTLGRAATLAEYLADKPYVSRRQAHLTVENGRVYIVHGGGPNPTCLNNRPLREGAPEELHEGDEIALGGMTLDGERQALAAYFTVSAADGG
ncbi:MAG: FHA domain-containing protein [Candidatus Fimadaptatus sp.]